MISFRFLIEMKLLIFLPDLMSLTAVRSIEAGQTDGAVDGRLSHSQQGPRAHRSDHNFMEAMMGDYTAPSNQAQA